MFDNFTDEQLEQIANLSEARILILEKDTLRTKEFQVLWDKQLAMDIYNYWSTLNGYWKANKIPNCTCADYEGGFMAKEQYNDYFYNGEPCSLEWFKQWQEAKERENESEQPSGKSVADLAAN